MDNEAASEGVPRRSVLDLVQQRTGAAARVLLRDAGSEHGASPIVDPKSPEKAQFTSGRHHYQVLGEIARGGMGVVLKGQDTELGREVAIKVLDERFVEQPAVMQRFVEEAQIGGQLQHPGVVPVYELGLMADERPFFSMKLVKGRTLSALLSARRALDEDRRRFLTILESVCQTVAYAHSKGVIHRDLKPANVMVGAFGEVQVVDWGLAKVLGQGGVEDEERARRTHLTVIETVRSGPGSAGSDSVLGSVMGTPAYMPPEQAMGEIEKIDERSDVFALGAILCEILTGQPPYVGTEKERTVVQAAHARLEPARERLEQCEADPELVKLALECLATARTVRPRNADEVARRLQEHLASADERAREAELAAAEAHVKVAAARRARVLTIGLAAAVVLAVVSVGVTLRSRAMAQFERTAEVRRKLDGATAQVLDLQQRQQLSEALEVARGAQRSTGGSPGADDELRARAAELVASAAQRVDEAAAQGDREARNARLLSTLDEVRLEQLDLMLSGQERELDALFSQAFQDYGVPIDVEDLRPAVAALQESGIARALAPALDDWARARRELAGWNAHETRALTELAIDLDPDPDRADVREAILAADREELLTFAREAKELGYEAATMWALATALWDLDEREASLALCRLGAQVFPDHFLLTCVEAFVFRLNARHDLALPALRAAASLRPESARVRFFLGGSLSILGDLPAAIEAMRVAGELGWPAADVEYKVGIARWDLGEYLEAAHAVGRALALGSGEREWRTDHLALRYLGGEATRDELVADLRIERTRTAGEHIAYGLALVDHPEPSAEDAELALAQARAAIGLGAEDPFLWTIECQALALLGRAEELLELLERWELRETAQNPFDAAMRATLRVKAWHTLGDDERAREQLDLARSKVEWVTANDARRWANSRLVLGLREGESLLGD